MSQSFKVYILGWSWSDKSASGVVAVFLDKDQAEFVHKVLCEFADRQFEIVEKEVIV